jgi:hypothetical protein
MDKESYLKLAKIAGSLKAIHFILDKKYIVNSESTLLQATKLVKTISDELDNVIQTGLEKDIRCV